MASLVENSAPGASENRAVAAAEPGVAASPPSSPSHAVNPDVVVITRQDELLLELQPFLPLRTRLRPADTAADASLLIRRNRRPQVLFLDTRHMESVPAEVEVIRTEVPHVVMLLLMQTPAAPSLPQEMSGIVHALLPLPLDAEATAAALGRALQEALTRKPTHVVIPGAGERQVPVAPPVPDEDIHTPPPVPAPRYAMLQAAAVCGFLLLGSGAVAWLLTPRQAYVPALEQVETSILAGTVDNLLESGRRALHERRFTSPHENNALTYYRSALATDPRNAEALDGLQRVAAVLEKRFDHAMRHSHLDEAGTALANLELAAPQHPQLSAWRLQLLSARIAVAEAQSEVKRMAALVRQAEQSHMASADQIGRWRSALRHLREERRLRGIPADWETATEVDITDSGEEASANSPASSEPAVPLATMASASSTPSSQLLSSAYLDRAREAALRHADSEMDHWLEEAQSTGATPAEVEAVRRASGTQHRAPSQADAERLLGLFHDRLREGRLTAPEQDSAAYYLVRLQTQQPGSPTLMQAGRELSSRLLARAWGYLNQGRISLADADLAQLHRCCADTKDPEALRALEAARSAQSQPSAAAGGAPAESSPASPSLRAEPTLPRYPPDLPPEGAGRPAQRPGDGVLLH